MPEALEVDTNLGWKSQDKPGLHQLATQGWGLSLSLFDFAVGVFPAN